MKTLSKQGLLISLLKGLVMEDGIWGNGKSRKMKDKGSDTLLMKIKVFMWECGKII